MTTYREHWHMTPGGPSAMSVQTDGGHHHGEAPRDVYMGEQCGDFDAHCHKTGLGPSTAPRYSKEVWQPSVEDLLAAKGEIEQLETENHKLRLQIAKLRELLAKIADAAVLFELKGMKRSIDDALGGK